MIKTNEAKPDSTLCDWCKNRATVFCGPEALCAVHAKLVKTASKDELPLKSGAVTLAPKHTK